MKVKGRIGPAVKTKAKVKGRVGPIRDWQALYTRGCMLLFFHKVLYEHRAAPCIADSEYDRLERYVEKLEDRPDVTKHPLAPTRKATCPHYNLLPRTVHLWLELYDKSGQPPALPSEVTG